jgi:hypothetical protein
MQPIDSTTTGMDGHVRRIMELNSQAIALAAVNRLQEAAAILGIARGLARVDSAKPVLATILNNLGVVLAASSKSCGDRDTKCHILRQFCCLGELVDKYQTTLRTCP